MYTTSVAECTQTSDFLRKLMLNKRRTVKMSIMKTNIAKREKSLMAAKAIGSLMAIAVLAIVIFLQMW